ncbi:MAG: undecaprenyldiphospho-muramoylpentapeptide beta-N-acetylglucosaminyltransferase [Melioribacteraceae bacterium]|nr:undecaprenyldiphospho-muramoylpentapeptide beta-N-acetylglucosaminyltransferase [Melioribacteraceae bacterium]
MKLNNSTIKYRYLFAGGGTGGHLYPAIAVAQRIRELQPNSDILFIGTKNKIESRVVPNLGFRFKSIIISGFNRQLNMKNILFPFKLVIGMIQSLLINIKFKPLVAIGTGAYVSGPAIWGATFMGAKAVLLEQNSYPGLTNRLLEKRARKIFLSFEESKKYFRNASKLEVSGNPIRVDITLSNKEEAKRSFGLDAIKKTLVIIGGSLGAKSINEALKNNVENLTALGIEVLWQTGELYYNTYSSIENENIKIVKYFDDIAKAYSAADLLIARAGATTIAEVAQISIPVIFVPSPNVAANHQYKNAKVLVDAEAAELIEDRELNEKLVDVVKDIIFDNTKLDKLKLSIKKFAKPDAIKTISNEIIKMASTI